MSSWEADVRGGVKRLRSIIVKPTTSEEESCVITSRLLMRMDLSPASHLQRGGGVGEACSRVQLKVVHHSNSKGETRTAPGPPDPQH